MRVEVARYVFASPDVVWSVLTDWERQPEWMPDARAVEVLTPHRTGLGVRLRCPTRVLGATVDDVLEVTGWQEQRLLEVAHIGRIITGTAAFELSPRDVGTQVVWWEDVDPPLGPVGEFGARMVIGPWLRWLFGRSIDLLRRRCEDEARRRRLAAVRGGR